MTLFIVRCSRWLSCWLFTVLGFLEKDFQPNAAITRTKTHVTHTLNAYGGPNKFLLLGMEDIRRARRSALKQLYPPLSLAGIARPIPQPRVVLRHRLAPDGMTIRVSPLSETSDESKKPVTYLFHCQTPNKILDICIMSLLRSKIDNLHCALLAVIVIIAVYIALGSDLFNIEADTFALPASLKKQITPSIQNQLRQANQSITKELHELNQ